jgi:hypothetical protein
LTALALAAVPVALRGDEAPRSLAVSPMPAPVPALKYQLLPDLCELNPGNPAQNYLKCFMERRTFFFGKESAAERARYQAMPLAELPADKLRGYGGSALRQADWAARLDALDWQVPDPVQNGGRDTQWDELGPLQNLAAALQVRFRAEVAGRHFNDAIRTAKTMFALSRHLGEYPSGVASLVAMGVAHLTLGTLEEMVRQPGCPNLFWALTDLPCPLVDLRKGAHGDRNRVTADLRALRDDAPMIDAEIEKFVSRLSGALGFAREQAGQAPRSVRARLRALVNNPEQVRAARLRLTQTGLGAELVKSFPPMQAILLDEKRDHEVQRDERLKLLSVPLWQLDAPAGLTERSADPGGLFADLLPHVHKLRRSQATLERQVAGLRHVEALRLYAAAHDGRLPAKLSDIPVPLPVNPFTGQPFLYTVREATAHVRGGSPPSDDTLSDCTLHYAVTVRK